MDHSLLTAAANESIYRRGSIAIVDGSPGVASAVPPRLRMNRRASIPYNPIAEDNEPSEPVQSTSSGAVVATQQAASVAGSGHSLKTPQVSGDAEPRMAQWESRMTMDGRTYYCNIFTDRTAWTVDDDGAAADADRRSPALELIGDEITLVHVSTADGAGTRGRRALAPALAVAPQRPGAGGGRRRLGAAVCRRLGGGLQSGGSGGRGRQTRVLAAGGPGSGSSQAASAGIGGWAGARRAGVPHAPAAARAPPRHHSRRLRADAVGQGGRHSVAAARCRRCRPCRRCRAGARSAPVHRRGRERWDPSARTGGGRRTD
ncbi:hypothetical protein DL89DRAFT_109581 [Linderina pennispora]|uniref:WW domain-containing protein n=1 Tax=Linderina pennispora TaxID=61395 RepID=A0A1Y1WFA1_9FUNG|nr:uncharacterized protein DL89DRAFT_109581 [Linderina pennispora]ORX72167.1 hypothetical protein DL89DRAFT_109581 [Linderina pennispora]